MPVNTVEDLLVDPQLEARHYFQSLTHADLGEARHLGAPYRFGADGWSLRWAAPRMGHDTQPISNDQDGMA